jgi:Flp pilus assembly CpaF family ATPase
LNSGRLSLEDRRRHLYIAGKTSVGKTTLILNMLLGFTCRAVVRLLARPKVLRSM